jgi:hypothetical protein
MSFFAFPGGELGQQPLQPVDRLHSLPGELLTAVGEHPQRLQLVVVGQHPQVRGPDRDHGDRVRIVCVGLSVVPGVEQPRPSRQLGRHIDHPFTVREQSLRQRPARAVAALDSPDPLRPSRHRLPHRGVAGLVRAEPACGQHDLVVVDDLDRRRQPVGIDPDKHVRHVVTCLVVGTCWDREVGIATTSWAVPS